MTAHLVKAATKLNNNVDSKKYTHLPALPLMCVFIPLEEDSGEHGISELF